MNNEKKNSEGYLDLTAYNAIKHVEEEERVKRLIFVLKYIIKNSGFELVERIHIRDKDTGREYK